MRFRHLFFGAFVAVALLGFPVGAQQTPTATNDANDFAALVKRGDKARIARDLSKAVEAYRDALKLRDDPLIAGRLGLVLFEMREFDIAAEHLQHAVEKPSDAVSDAEYAQFSRAYKAVQREVCRIDVTIDQRGTRLEVDGEVQQEGRSDFWFFVTPGTHTLRVTLEGYEDEIKEIDAERGGQMLQTFTMRPIVKPAPAVKQVAPSEPQPATKTNLGPPVPEDKPTAKTNPRSRGRFVVGGGVAFVFLATPSPALGPQVFAAWRSQSWWEIGLDARVGWTVITTDDFPDTQFVTWSATLSPCGRWRDRWFACALVQLDGVALDTAPGIRALPGLGARGGIEFAAYDRLHFQVWADVIARHRGFSFATANASQWNGPFASGTLGARAVVTF